jgi:hypothetical protein
VWKFEMLVHHTDVEMYRDTTDRRNIQKKVGAMPEKNGRSDQTFTKQNQNEKREGQQRNKRPTMRYVRNKGNARLDTIDQQILTLALR